MSQQLIDNFQRRVNYLRISVTDRCDFRCVYCMSEKMTFLPRAQLLTLEEIAWIGRAFVELGVTKIRITGGEALVRHDIMRLFRQLGKLDGLNSLVLTTNGSQLSRYAQELKQAGVKRINISLDSLRPERFKELTRTGELKQVLQGIEAAKHAGFAGLKLNTVILRNRNDDEILDLVHFAIEQQMDISFIEEMPLGEVTEHQRSSTYYSNAEIFNYLKQHFSLIASNETTGGPARYQHIANTTTKVGFISPHSHNFCESCNRVRLTTEGKLLLCLGQEHSVDLRQVIRAHPHNLEMLKQTIVNAMQIKPQGHDFDIQRAKPVIFRYMSTTGG